MKISNDMIIIRSEILIWKKIESLGKVLLGRDTQVNQITILMMHHKIKIIIVNSNNFNLITRMREGVTMEAAKISLKTVAKIDKSGK